LSAARTISACAAPVDADRCKRRVQKSGAGPLVAAGTRMALEWSDLKVLLALARAGSVAGAARELQVDHSTISRRLAALEDAVGTKLLIRGGREFNLTADGRAMLEAAEAAEAATAAALRTVRAAKVEAQGHVSVSVAPAFVPVLMRELIPALRQSHPLLGVELRGSFARADLARGEADIALRMARPHEPDLVARRAMDTGWCVYAARSYLSAHGCPAVADELNRHDLVLYADNLHSAPPTRWLEPYKNAAHTAARMDSLETACQAALAGGGIVMLPAFVGDAVDELQRVFAAPVASNTGWVVYHESVREHPRIRAVADALIAFFQGHEAMFTGAASA
jgi:DNA-binding transcriptional LysR family regulator